MRVAQGGRRNFPYTFSEILVFHIHLLQYEFDVITHDEQIRLLTKLIHCADITLQKCMTCLQRIPLNVHHFKKCKSDTLIL
jgi:hypothetical protein